MKEIVLTDEQKTFILQNYDKMNLNELVQKIFNNPELNGVHAEGRAVRKFLGQQSLSYKTTKFVKAPDIILTPEQKEFIVNNAATQNALEIAKTLFNDNTLTQLHKETQAVYKAIRELPKELVRPQDFIIGGLYQAPKSISRAISKINKFCNLDWKEENIGSREIECCEAMIRYLNSYRFLYMINAYKKEKDRELFESQFVSHTYDKPDLNSEFLNGYLNLCAEYVIMANAQEQKEILDERLRLLSEDDQQKMSMSLTEAIAAKSEEISSSINRQKSMIGDLVGKRSNIIKEKYNENAALTNFFELWKNKIERDTLVRLAKQRQLILKDEVNRLDKLDEVIAKIQGLSEEEIVN